MKGFPRRGSDVRLVRPELAGHLVASMKGFPRRGSDLTPGTSRVSPELPQ